MKTYIAKIKEKQSIIFLADDDKDAIKWANDLKREIYGECELISIWNHEENKEIKI